jgi:hypothetical protein
MTNTKQEPSNEEELNYEISSNYTGIFEYETKMDIIIRLL